MAAGFPLYTDADVHRPPIDALLGPSSLQTTERYTQVEIQDLQDVIRPAHPRGRAGAAQPAVE